MNRERGSGRLGVIIWIAIMGAAVFAAAQIIPMKIAVYEFHDYVENESRFMATRGRFDPSGLEKSILEKADELGLPLDPKQVDVQHRGKRINVHVQHSVEVDLTVYKWVWQYDKEFENLAM